MRFLSAPLGLAALAGTCALAAAAPATTEGAQALQSSLQRYLVAPGGISPVTVTPAGDGYTLAFDLKRIMAPFERLGLVLAPTTYTISAAPLDNGLWHVTNASLPRLTATVNDTTVSVVANGTTFDGTFDAKIPSFTKSTGTYDSVSVATVNAKEGTQTREQRQSTQHFDATPTADGVVNLTYAEDIASTSQDLTRNTPARKGTPASISAVSIKSGPTAQSATFDEIRVRALNDLWIFLVGHPSADALKASQSDLRQLLKQAMPLFKHFAAKGSVQKIAAETPVGPIALDTASGRLALNGLAQDGLVESEIKVSGLSIPAALTPAWASGLVPSTVELAESLTGYRLDGAVQEAIDTFDLTAPKPLTPETLDKMAASVGPLEQLVVHIAPSRIASRLLDIHFDGEVHMKQPIPDFTVNVTASGLDDAIKEVQAKAGNDRTAAQLIAAVLLIKGFGKAGPDGSLTWAVAKGAAGEITVNGIAMPFGAK